MTKKNPIFCSSKPTWANACVGNDGYPDDWTYSRGFSKAANFLIKAVVKSRGFDLNVDEFIYPACFNFRHSVELRLKGAIQTLQRIAEIRGDKLQFDSAASHGLKLIWNFFSQQAVNIDKRYSLFNKN